MTTYSITIHQHRLAAWAACRAASVKDCRFKVRDGVKYLAACGLDESLASPDQLPDPVALDRQHRLWRESLIQSAARSHSRVLSHGIAAKLINIYLKVRFVCAWYHDHERVRGLHPPIDSLLLDSLCEQNVGGLRADWQSLRKVRWSKFASVDYERAIVLIRKALDGQSLWKIEEYWQGYQ